jgi:hypothetical protein
MQEDHRRAVRRAGHVSGDLEVAALVAANL